MHIVLLILKIIGISLLVILGILILLIGIVLFVPIRYKVAGDIRRTTKEKVAIHGKVTWLCSAIAYVFSYEDNEFQGELRIFGRKRKEKSPTSLEDLMDEDEAANKKTDKGVETTEENYEVVQPLKNEELLDSDGSDKPNDISYVKKETTKQATLKAAPKPKENIFQKVIHKIRSTVERITSFFKNIKEKISLVKAFVSDEVNKRVCKKIFAEVLKFLKHLRFRKLRTDLQYGFSDPAITGQSFGVICMIPVFYQYDVAITPDFEAEGTYMEGIFDAKGHLRICHAVMMLIRLLLDKDVRMKFVQLMHNMNK